MIRKEIAKTGLTLLPLLAIPVVAAAQAPGLVAGANGEVEVVFAGGCTVTYDAEGRRMGLTACSNDELLAAQDAYAAHLREDAEEAAEAAAKDRISPQIIAGANREAEVVFSANCVVQYDAEGQRVREMGSYEDGFWPRDDNHELWDLPNVVGFERRR